MKDLILTTIVYLLMSFFTIFIFLNTFNIMLTIVSYIVILVIFIIGFLWTEG